MVLVKNANRMMTTASLLDDGLELGFDDGLKGLIPYGEVPEVQTRKGISGLDLPNPYEMVLRTAGGESVEIPRDFARHYCDATYQPTVEALSALGRQTVGERVRQFRESSGLTQQVLARAANIGRATLVRLEKGELRWPKAPEHRHPRVNRRSCSLTLVNAVCNYITHSLRSDRRAIWPEYSW